ncbi:MAG: hypothetical protein V7K49_33575 [Nostoc sp.]
MSLSTTWRNNRHGFKRSDRLSAHHHITVPAPMPNLFLLPPASKK